MSVGIHGWPGLAVAFGICAMQAPAAVRAQENRPVAPAAHAPASAPIGPTLTGGAHVLVPTWADPIHTIGSVEAGNTLSLVIADREAPAPIARSDSPRGPRPASVGFQRSAHSDPLERPQARGAHVGAGPNVALMGAGAAGVVLGLMIGGDGGKLLALGSGVVGIVGLYRYLR